MVKGVVVWKGDVKLQGAGQLRGTRLRKSPYGRQEQL